jgi:hypothetical protein
MDERLFVDEKLYCEGKPKPWFRGKIHLVSLVFIAPAIYFSQNNIWSHINIITNFCCFGVSGYITHSLGLLTQKLCFKN